MFQGEMFSESISLSVYKLVCVRACSQLSGLALTFAGRDRKTFCPCREPQQLSGWSVYLQTPLELQSCESPSFTPRDYAVPLCLTSLASSSRLGCESDLSGRKAAGLHGRPILAELHFCQACVLEVEEEAEDIQESRSQFPLSLPRVLADFQKEMLSNLPSDFV